MLRCYTLKDINEWCRYAVYVLEASTSNRLTYFLPPLVSDNSIFINITFQTWGRAQSPCGDTCGPVALQRRR
jgi:hypothetical protein